jgi:UDP-N-acetylglucosamine:LPS N-acetylglucosamine transferase
MRIDDSDCTPARIGAEIRALVDDPARWQAMAAASLALGLLDATDSVVRLIVEAAGPPRSKAA